MNNFNLKIDKIVKKGKCRVLNDKYVLKECSNNYYEYLKTRGFNYYPLVVDNKNNLVLSQYIVDKELPIGQRLEDMIYVISLLHLDTSYNKKIDMDNIKEKYESLIDRLDGLMKYYLSLQDLIEEEEFMSPANYLLIRNVSLIYYSIKESRKHLDIWYKKMESIGSVRYVYNHGNLDISHFLEDDNMYLISWNKARLDLPIYDIEDFYRKNFLSIKLDVLLDIYSKKYALTDYEKYLLFSLLLIPDKIDMNKKEYPRIKDITYMISYLEDTIGVLKNYSKEHDIKHNK